VAPILAGWFAGYAVALAWTIVLTYLAMHVRTGGILGRVLSPEMPGPLLAVPVSIGNVLLWTLVGLVLGAIYQVGDLDTAPDGLGSPSVGFTVGMASLAVVPLIVLLVLWPRDWWAWILGCASFAAAFGWLLPHLAGR
jgi:hypothetical protein